MHLRREGSSNHGQSAAPSTYRSPLKLPELLWCVQIQAQANCSRSIYTDDEVVVVVAAMQQEKIFKHVYVYGVVVIMLMMKNDERENNI